MTDRDAHILDVTTELAKTVFEKAPTPIDPHVQSHVETFTNFLETTYKKLDELVPE